MSARTSPGPWRHYTNLLRPQFGTVIHEIQDVNGTPIVLWGGFDGALQKPAQLQANIHLMVAAPQLHAQLKKAIALLTKHGITVPAAMSVALSAASSGGSE